MPIVQATCSTVDSNEVVTLTGVGQIPVLGRGPGVLPGPQPPGEDLSRYAGGVVGVGEAARRQHIP